MRTFCQTVRLLRLTRALGTAIPPTSLSKALPSPSSLPNARTRSLLPDAAVEPEGTRVGRYNGRLWAGDEDKRLRMAVAELGEGRWVEVAARVGNGRTNRGCRQRWLNCMRDTGRRRPFSAHEVGIILERTQQNPRQWTRVAAELGGGRTGAQVREFVVHHLGKNRRGIMWTREEDQRLREAVAELGVGRWSGVAARLPGRSDCMCYSRWTFTLAPELRKGKWGADEDEALVKAWTALRKSGKPFHFGHVADLLENKRHRKACRARLERLMRNGVVEEAALA